MINNILKSQVLLRNQIAHVKAERDILKEADNEWIVKLYYRWVVFKIIIGVKSRCPNCFLNEIL